MDLDGMLEFCSFQEPIKRGFGDTQGLKEFDKSDASFTETWAPSNVLLRALCGIISVYHFAGRVANNAFDFGESSREIFNLGQKAVA
jgi:hypothetical protein